MMKKIWEWILTIIDRFSVEEMPQDKILIEYITVKDNLAKGTLKFKGLVYEILSGPYGRGYAPRGKYTGYKIQDETREAFVQHKIGWQFPIKPEFKCDRTLLALHPDGNILGSLGCVVVNFDNERDNILLRNAIRNWILVHGKLKIEII